MRATGLGHAIDFGTSTSAITVCGPGGATTPVADPGGDRGAWSIPTSVFVPDDGPVLVGTAARRAGAARPDAYRREFKREFGSPDLAMVGSTAMTAADMTVHVLRFLRELAQDRVPGDPDQVVITIPASWEAGRQAAMRDAAAAAGYDSGRVSLVPEPVAALADVFGDRGVGSELTVLVYDLGGGTFDCALARGTHNRFEVLGVPGGIGDIGGADFDGLLLGLLRERLGADIAGLLDGPAADIGVLARRLSLRDECERIKCTLSAKRQCEDVLTALRPPPVVRVERVELERAIRPLLAETISECERLLRQLGLTWADVGRVVPAGGSSKIPLVQEMLSQSSGLVVLRPDDPARSVISGAAAMCHAALRGRDLTGPTGREPAGPAGDMATTVLITRPDKPRPWWECVLPGDEHPRQHEQTGGTSAAITRWWDDG